MTSASPAPATAPTVPPTPLPAIVGLGLSDFRAYLAYADGSYLQFKADGTWVHDSRAPSSAVDWLDALTPAQLGVRLEYNRDFRSLCLITCGEPRATLSLATINPDRGRDPEFQNLLRLISQRVATWTTRS